MVLVDEHLKLGLKLFLILIDVIVGYFFDRFS